MLSGLLITINILVCVALIAVVLLQRSEGGAFGMGGGPTGLITARGAGDLLTRTTWVLFSLFLAISLALTLLSAHDRATSSVLEKLKLQQLNPNVLSQPKPAATPAPAAPAPQEDFSGLPLAVPPATPANAPLGAAPTAPKAIAATPTQTSVAGKHAAPKAAGAAPKTAESAPKAADAAPVMLNPPPPAALAAPEPKSDPNAPAPAGAP